MDSDASSCCSVFVGGFEPSSPTLSSSSGSNDVSVDDAVEYCQCIDSEDQGCLCVRPSVCPSHPIRFVSVR
jgi:hypothetical protein